MEGQQFCLRWHNFQATLLSSLPKLLDGGHLTDVTLSAGGRHIHAHRIILSACSYYFKELFKDLSSLQHPVIVLPGMEYANLCALVKFMYNGEVNIYQEQLPALLAMADTLNICGLADIAGKNPRHDNGLYVEPPTIESQKKLLTEEMLMTEPRRTPTNPSELTQTTSAPLPAERTDNLDDDEEEPAGNEQENVSYCVKTKPYYSINAKLNQRERVLSKYAEKGYSDGATETVEAPAVTEEQQQITPLATEDVKPPPDMWDAGYNNSKLLAPSASGRTSSSSQQQTYNKSSVTCVICGKQLSNQYNLRVHMETHSNSSYSCTACPHVSRSRDALRKHVSYRHPVAPSQKRPRYNTASKPPL